MNVLITGSAGYVGTRTAKALARADLKPIAVDNLCRGHRQAVQWGPFVEADISDRRALRKMSSEYQIGAVIHFAGYPMWASPCTTQSCTSGTILSYVDSPRYHALDAGAQHRIFLNLRDPWKSAAASDFRRP